MRISDKTLRRTNHRYHHIQFTSDFINERASHRTIHYNANVCLFYCHYLHRVDLIYWDSQLLSSMELCCDTRPVYSIISYKSMFLFNLLHYSTIIPFHSVTLRLQLSLSIVCVSFLKSKIFPSNRIQKSFSIIKHRNIEQQTINYGIFSPSDNKRKGISQYKLSFSDKYIKLSKANNKLFALGFKFITHFD